MERKQYESTTGGLESLEQLSLIDLTDPSMNIVELSEKAMTEVYSKYSFKRKEDTNNLSINDFKQQVIN